MIDIPDYGLAEVKDRGGAIKGTKLDVYFDTHQEALNWGKPDLMVKIYE
jgi:3D (Asp-Asp-Asp) domain-containing protein